jgi:hypothetical protein
VTKSRLAGILLAAIFSLTGSEAPARPFSAQDVMSVCLTTPREIQQVADILLADGWSVVSGETTTEALLDVRVAFIAAQFSFVRPIHGTPRGPEEWLQDWSAAQEFPQKDRLANQTILLRHAESGAKLFLADRSKSSAKTISCLLAVPRAVLKDATYFPKLRSPTAPALSFSVIDFMHSESIRSSFRIISTSLDPVGISSALNVQTEVGAAFFSSVTYPVLAVEP